MLFLVVIGLVIVQRLVELIIAKKNEMRLKGLGGYEVGETHYKLIVSLHLLFFLSLLIEKSFFQSEPIMGWTFLLAFFFFLQLFRIWTIYSLGMHWNTKIIILPGANPVIKGPYRFIKHPNYLIVILELLIIPLMFQAYFTAIVFTSFNLFILLKIRIPQEEKALIEATTYMEQLGMKNRFLP